MNIVKRLISNLRSKRYSTSKLRERHMLKDYKYIKQAFQKSSNYLRVQAVEYLGNFENQENLDFLVEEFKSIENVKLRSYTYKSIILIAKNKNLNISNKNEFFLKNKYLLKNIGVIRKGIPKEEINTPITFIAKSKDLLKELDDKKKLNENMIGF